MVQPAPTPSPREQFTGFVSWLAFACHVLETSVAVFLRQGFGRRYFGVQSALVLAVHLLWVAGWPEHDPTGMYLFMGAYVLSLAWAQQDSIRRQRRGEIQHSYYSGAPYVSSWPLCRRLGERAVKGIVEPLLVLVAAWLVMPIDEALGSYLATAAVGTAISVGLARAAERKRLMDMRDAYIEQQNLANRFRDGHWH